MATHLAQSGNIAYFSMEVGIDPTLPTYSGGLGILAGDTLRAAADMGLPVVAVTMLYRKGYFRQHLDAKGQQTETPVAWSPEDVLQPVTAAMTVTIEGRPVKVRAWRYDARGAKGHVVPVYFLDTGLAENTPADQALSDQLYGGDEHYRLCQEAVLGLGGVALLKALGLPPRAEGEAVGIDTYHMNEGHAALLTVALLQHRLGKDDVQGASPADLQFVRDHAIFTTHTPVPAGHDSFPVTLVETILGKPLCSALVAYECCPADRLNMSVLALRFSRYVNGVAKRHGEISRQMFPKAKVEAITNGVHAESWTADAVRSLFDQHLKGWREDNNYLRYACELPLDELKAAHQKAKLALFDAVENRAGMRLDPDVFTIGFARRATEYKRADLLFHDPEELIRIGKRFPLQIVFAGKAHPKDLGGKKMIERVFEGASTLAKGNVRVAYVENYDMELGRLITSGVDLWLNNPVKPLEASGTSGMKAAINGVPSLSTLDGWWVEGCIEGVTGWEIRDDAYAFSGKDAHDRDDGKHRAGAVTSLYGLLESEILQAYYEWPTKYLEVMRNAIAVNGSYFNTHRMVLQYFVQAYTRRLK